MAFPTNPINNQYYNGYKYDSTKGTWERVGAGIIESGYVSGRGWYVKYGDGTLHCFGRIASYNALTTGAGGWKIITMATPAYSKALGETSVVISCQGWAGASAEFTTEQPSYADIAVFNRGEYPGDTDMYFDFWGRWKA